MLANCWWQTELVSILANFFANIFCVSGCCNFIAYTRNLVSQRPRFFHREEKTLRTKLSTFFEFANFCLLRTGALNSKGNTQGGGGGGEVRGTLPCDRSHQVSSSINVTITHLILSHMKYYYMAGSVSGQNKANSAF